MIFANHFETASVFIMRIGLNYQSNKLEFEMQNEELWCPLRGKISIISEGNTFILHFAFIILHSQRGIPANYNLPPPVIRNSEQPLNFS